MSREAGLRTRAASAHTWNHMPPRTEILSHCPWSPCPYSHLAVSWMPSPAGSWVLGRVRLNSKQKSPGRQQGGDHIGKAFHPVLQTKDLVLPFCVQPVLKDLVME